MPEDDLHRFSLEIHGLYVTVRGDCGETIAKVDGYLLPWIPRITNHPAGPDLAFQITRHCGSDRFRISMGDRVLSDSEAMPYLFALIQQAVDDALIARLGDCAAVHAGVVGLGGKAILLPGKSGSGKTSLVHELVRCGAEYYSDEYAIVDSKGWVHPYPRALMLRDGNQEQHPVLASEIGETGYAASRWSGACSSVPAPLPPGAILFLEYHDGYTFGVHPVSAGDALLDLLSNTPHVLEEKPGIRAPLLAASRLAPSYHGRRGAASEAADAIARLALAHS